MLPEWRVNQVVRLAGGRIDLSSVGAATAELAAQ
jgi:hypothetical protein